MIHPRPAVMKSKLQQTLIAIWRQTLVKNAESVELGKERYPVRRAPKRKLRQVEFVFGGND